MNIATMVPRRLRLTLLLALSFCIGGSAFAQDVVIRVLRPGGDQPNMKQVFDKIASDFEAANPGITIQGESVSWDDAYQKITTSVLAGDAADVIYIGGRWVAPFTQIGALLPLDDYADAAKLATFPDGALQQNRFQGSLRALPVAFSTKVLFYRTDLIDSPPTTWDELLATAQQVTEDNPGTYGIGIPGASHVSTTGQFFTFLYQAGGQVFDDEGNVALDSPEAVKALTFYTDLYTKYGVTPNPIEYNREQLPELFKQGKIAMMIIGPWGKTIMGLDEDNPDVPYATAVLPCGERCGGIQVGDSVAVWQGTEHPDEAYAFVDYWTSLEPHTYYDLNTGLTPLVAGEQDDPTFDTPFWKPFIAMIDQGFPQPSPLAWEPFQGIITDMIQNVLLGNQTPEEALQAASAAIEEQDLEPAAVR